MIIARTDAVAVEGFEVAIAPVEAYMGAGAGVLFIEAPLSGEELTAIADRFRGRIPLLANMVEGGETPIQGTADLETKGFSIVIFPGGIVWALPRAAVDYYTSLKAHGSNRPFAHRMYDFDGLNAWIGTPEMLALGARYEDDRAPCQTCAGSV